MECIDCKSKCNKLFAKLTKAELEILNNKKVCFSATKGTMLYLQNSLSTNIYCLHSGVVKLFVNVGNGNEQIMRMMRADEVFGFGAISASGRENVNAIVYENAQICSIDIEVFNSLAAKNASLYKNLYELYYEDQNSSHKAILFYTQYPVKQRVAYLVYHAYKKFGIDTNGYVNIQVKRNEFANLVGTATESLIRHLAEFRDEGVLKTKGRFVRILDLEKLKAYLAIR